MKKKTIFISFHVDLNAVRLMAERQRPFGIIVASSSAKFPIEIAWSGTEEALMPVRNGVRSRKSSKRGSLPTGD